MLCGALLLGGLWLLWRRQREQSSENLPAVATRQKVAMRGARLRYKVHVDKQRKATLPPPGYSRRVKAGVFPISQLVGTILEGAPSSQGLYSVTFSHETLEALRSGNATLMQSLKGDRAIAVRLNGKIKELGTVTRPGFDVGRACFATVSLVTGQYFLTRIDQKLQSILAGVQDIQNRLDSGERADLNIAKGCLQAWLTIDYQDGCREKDAQDFRNYRTKCQKIAARNLEVLKNELVLPQSCKSLGSIELAGEKFTKISGWVDNQVSKLRPSRRENSLISEAREFAEAMTRGLLALQLILCIEAILEHEDTSHSAEQACSMVKSYGVMQESYQTRFREKKDVALGDHQYGSGDEKRKRMLQKLQGLLDPVETHWRITKEMEDQWRLRSRTIPEMLYVSVNEAGQPVEVFLPDNNAS